MGYARTRVVEPPRWVAAIVGFFGTLAVVIVASLFVTESWSVGVQVLVAFALACVPAAIVLYTIRRTSIEFIVAWIGLLLLSLCVWALAATQIRRTIDLARLDRESVDIFARARERVAAIDAGRDVNLGPLPSKPSSEHPREMARYHIETAFWKRIDSYKRYLADLKASQWDRMTEPSLLRDAKERQLGDARFRAANAAVDAWDAREREHVDAFVAAMEALPLPQTLHSKISRNAKIQHRDMATLVYSDKLLLMRAQAFARTLTNSRWTLQGESVYFYDDASLSAFQAAQAQLQRAVLNKKSVAEQINQRADAIIGKQGASGSAQR